MSERLALNERPWELAAFEAGKGETSGAAEGKTEGAWFQVSFPATVKQAHAATKRELPENWRALEWWYRCRFEKPAGKDRVVRLCIAGADYRAVTYLNGEPLGDRRGGYGPAWYDVSQLLQDTNTLAICIKPISEADDRMLNPARNPLRWPSRGEIACDDAGVWDEVILTSCGRVYFDGWLAHGESTGDHGDLSVRLEINNTQQTTQATIRLSVEGPGLPSVEQSFPVELATGTSTQELSLVVPGARSWNPRALGEPVLYTVRGEIALGGGVVDTFQQPVGFRSIKVVRSGTDEQLWRVQVNGRKLQLRGVNWTGLPLAPHLSYEKIVGDLAAAGVNAIRVWGGRHRRAFYEACDRMGLLVVQEFPLGYLDGNSYPRETPDFPQAKEIVRTSRTDNNAFVRHLRNHPSIFLWVGGTRLHNKDNAHVMRTVEDALRKEDGSRPYVPTFPNAGSHMDLDVRRDGLSPEHLEDGVPLLLAQGLPAWPAGQEAPEGLTARWRKYGGEAAHVRAVAWAAGGRRTQDTAGGFVGEVIDWTPEGGFGLFDFSGAPRRSLEVLKGLYAPVAAGLSFDWKAYRSGTWDAEVWGVRDDGGVQLSARVRIVDATGQTSASADVKGALVNGRGELGEVRLALQGQAPFTAIVEADGGFAVPYPLDAPKPVSSFSLAEIAQTRLAWEVQSTSPYALRVLGTFGFLPVEYLLRGILAVRITLGV